MKISDLSKSSPFTNNTLIVLHSIASMTSRQRSATVRLQSCSRSSIETIEKLKLRNDVSIIDFVQYRNRTGQVGDNAKVVDALVALLNTNHNLKRLNCRVTRESTVSLFEALAAGKAGYNLESLQQLNEYFLEAEVTLLRRYLTKNQNLKRLGVALDEGQEAVQLVSALACSTVVELEIIVFSTHGCLQELGTKLGQCNSIHSLRISFVYADSQLGDMNSFLKVGLSSMRYLEHIKLRVNCSRSVWRDPFLEMVKTSRSITKATLNDNVGEVEPFQDEVNSFCVLNRVFGTNLIGFEPTELWTRVYTKIRDDSARATFLFRLLREKPELLIADNDHSICRSSKRQKMAVDCTHDDTGWP